MRETSLMLKITVSGNLFSVEERIVFFSIYRKNFQLHASLPQKQTHGVLGSSICYFFLLNGF